MAERKLFNKGIAIYKKDFFLVQKLVSWSSVSGASEGRSCLQGLGLSCRGGGGCSCSPSPLAKRLIQYAQWPQRQLLNKTRREKDQDSPLLVLSPLPSP